MQQVEKWAAESALPTDFQRGKLSEDQASRLLRALEASQKLASYWEQKYRNTSTEFNVLREQHDVTLREVHRAMTARLDVEDSFGLEKAELTRKLKLETQRIDRMWHQKYEQLRKALAKEADQGGRMRSRKFSEESSPRRRVNSDSSSRSRGPARGALPRRKLTTEMDKSEAQDQADSSDSESDTELHVKVRGGGGPGSANGTGTSAQFTDFNPYTDDPAELDSYLFHILSRASNKQDEFLEFCEGVDCGNLARFYLKSAAFIHLAKKEEVPSEETRKMAVDMFDTYLKSDSKQCIQLPSALTQRPSMLLVEGKTEVDMFAECQKHVRTILRKDVLPAYLNMLCGGPATKKNNFTIELEPIATTNPDLVIQRWTTRFGLSKVHQDYLSSEIVDLRQRRLTEEETMAKLRDMEKGMDKLNYSLGSLIGAGAFGKVYRGSDRRSGAPVAIKVIDLEDVEGDIQTNFREVAALKGNERQKCPQMTEYIDSDVYGTKLWIIMEYMDGGSVQDRINVWKMLKEKHIAIIAREVLLGLQFLMNQGFIHRDIKAANILMKKNGAVKLADFGTSRDLTDTFAKCSAQTGSPCWMAPEVISSNESYDGKVDIWSLGITCLEMAQGCAPRSQSNQTPMQVMRQIVELPPPELPPGDQWSIYFRSFVAKCLVKDPAQRPSIQQLLQTAFIKRARKVAKLKKLFLQPNKTKTR